MVTDDEKLNATGGVNLKNSKNHIFIDDVEDIQKDIINSFAPLVKGKFIPFTKNESSAKIDEYYYLKQISRLETINYFYIMTRSKMVGQS